MDVHVPVSSAKRMGIYEGTPIILIGERPPLNYYYLLFQILYEHEFPVPRPIDQVRHCVLMEFVDAYPLFV